jgi:exosome complex RNA-binding protein Csl4
VANDPNLVLSGYVIPNNALITTSTPQTSEGDDFDNHPVTVTQPDKSNILGTVYLETESNTIFSGGDAVLGDVLVALSGTDIFGDPVYLT